MTHSSCQTNLLVLFLFLSQPLWAASQYRYQVSLTKSYTTQTLYCDINIFGTRLSNCMIDTGCSTVYLNYEDYVYFQAEGVISSENYVGEGLAKTSNGVVMRTRRYRISELKIGNALLRNIEVTFSTSKENGPSRLIGMNLFNCFDGMYIDNKTNTLYLYK